ncbi:MAG: IS1634 family transposase [Bacteroidaceae bacterium]|nr:IS1634 family transposase [Bacteroidaceae bacterium]
MCCETIKKLRISEFLQRQGFTEEQTALAVTQIAIRATHPASEQATAKWIKNNSDICRLTGYDMDKVTKDKLYKSAIRLYDVRRELMSHLSSWTKELFAYDDNLILYDLTNTYAEGCYDDSKVWDYGRSKEKRHDCKLIVLALVVNSHGFPKHYQLFDGRMTDTDSLQKIIGSLDEQMKSLGVSPIVVMDAGISTEDNLAMLKKKGYKYLCVSRSSSKAYDTIEGEERQQLKDNRGQTLEIQRVKVSHEADKEGNLPASATDTY